MTDKKVNNSAQITKLCKYAQALEQLLIDLEPELRTQVFALVLSLRSQEEIEAIMAAAKQTRQRRTLTEIVAPYKPVITKPTISFPDRKV
jgi:hypothetical protein